MELLLLAAVGVAAWFLWPRANGTTPAASAVAAIAPAVPKAGPTADDAITALTVVRDRLVLVNAPPEKIEAVLALAPALLAKEGK